MGAMKLLGYAFFVRLAMGWLETGRWQPDEVGRAAPADTGWWCGGCVCVGGVSADGADMALFDHVHGENQAFTDYWNKPGRLSTALALITTGRYC